MVGLSPPLCSVNEAGGIPKPRGTPKPPGLCRGVGLFLPVPASKEKSVLGSTHRRRESSFPLGPSPDLLWYKYHEPTKPQRRILSTQRP